MRISFSILGLSLILASSLGAQQGTTARAAGMAEAMSSVARGYEAGLFNPALLSEGVVNGTLLGSSLKGSFSPVGPSRLSSMGPRLEDAEKAELLEEIRTAGSMSIDGSMKLHWLGMAFGPVAVNLVTQAQGEGNLLPDAAEALLYGNVGQDGQADGLDASGSSAQGWVNTHLALSYGRVLPAIVPGTLSAGVTLRAGAMHGRGVMIANRASTTVDPFSVEFVGNSAGVEGGSTFGADLGLAWKKDAFRAGVVVRDLIASQPANLADATVYRVRVLSSMDSTETATDTLTFGDLSSADRAAIQARWDEKIATRSIVASGAYVTRRLTATAEARLLEERTEFALGAEVRPVSFLALRAGGLVGDGTGFSAGATLALGAVALDVGATQRSGTYEGGVFAAQLRFGR